MESEDMEGESRLIHLCIEAASESEASIEKWRRQRRSLERLPPHLAKALLHRLLRRRLLLPSLLELFKHSVEEIDLKGENSVDAEWMAYLGAFQYLRSLNVADCYRITNSALWSITGMTTLKEVDLSRCSKVTDAGINHLLSIPTLEKLFISETGVTANGVMLLSSLKTLSVLDLGGLPVTDQALSSLQELKKLQYLDLWGSKISNKGAAVLKLFPNLTVLNLAWTEVTKLPNLSSIACLNMSNCTIHSIFEADGDRSPLEKLIVCGATFTNEPEAFLYVDTSRLSFLDVSNNSLRSFCFLPSMNVVEHLDLSFGTFGDDSVELIASIGVNLRYLSLSNTKVSSAGLGNLAGQVPNLEVISLSHTPVDDTAILLISTMPSLKVIDLSDTNVRGFIHQVGAEPDWTLSLTMLRSLGFLESLNLEGTQVRDAALYPLQSGFKTLTHLSLKSDYLTDMSLHHLSCLPSLKNLGVCDAVLTNTGLKLFKPPSTLRMLDLTGCWLLTKDAILSFCEYHPLEVRHELVHFVPADQTGSTNSRASQVKHKQGKKPMLQSRLMEDTFLDQRLKYTREEMLALQTSSLSLNFGRDRCVIIPKMQMD